MTGHEAKQILKAPLFGDQRCIEARDLLLLMERVVSAQSWAMEQEWADAAEYPKPIFMSKKELQAELEAWYEAGYRG